MVKINMAKERAVKASITVRLLLNIAFCYLGDIATLLQVNLAMIHVFNIISVVTLLVLKREHKSLGARVLSGEPCRELHKRRHQKESSVLYYTSPYAIISQQEKVK